MKTLVLGLAVAGLAAAQIGIPGGGYPPIGYPGGYPPGYPGGSPYPGGGPYPGGSPYPGGPVPQTGPGTGTPVPKPSKKDKKSKSKDQGQPLPNFRGKLQQMDSKSISLKLDDDRIMEFRVTGKTKFTKSGEEIKAPKFDRGDQISVEASEEPDASLDAVNVYWEKAAAATTADSKQEKKDGVYDTWKDAPKEAPRTSEAAPQAAPRDPDDPGPPSLKRGRPADRPDTPLEASSAPSPSTPQPAASSQPAPPSQPAPRETASAPVPNVDLPPLPLPKSTAPRSPSQPAPRQTASAAPLPNVDLPPVELPRGERPEDQAPTAPRHEDPLIQKAAEAALEFTETLPNYVVQEMMSRSQSESQPANWRPIDVVSMEVVYEQGKENYRNIAINGKATTKPLSEIGGAYSTGEFGTMLIDLFSPATAAAFRPKGESRIAGINAKEYGFEVQRENSHWDLHFGPQTYSPAYSGTVWIDPSTARVLRIEMQALNLPKDFPSDHVESATDYQYVRLGGTRQFLLPVHAETLSCQRASSYCSRNTIDFRNYHKYEGQSTIEFSPVK